MSSTPYQAMMMKSPVGYAFHEMIFDDRGTPVDYRFVEINPAFEIMTGLLGRDIIGKTVTQVLPDLSHDSFDWIHYYGTVVSTGIPQAFEQFSETMNRWFSVNVYTPISGFFVTNIIDITQKSTDNHALKQLFETCDRLVQIDDRAIDHQQVADDILRLTDAKYAVFSLEEAAGKPFRAVAFSGRKAVPKKLISLFMRPLLGKIWMDERVPMISEALTKFGSVQKLVSDETIMTELAGLEEQEALGETFLIRIAKNDAILGGFTVMMERGRHFENDETVIAYSRHLGMTISRFRSEEQLFKSEEKYRNLIQHSHDIIYTLTLDGILDYVSPAWTVFLGYPVAEVIGQSYQKFIFPADLPRCDLFIRHILDADPSESHSIEYRVIHADGSVRWHHSHTILLVDETGAVIGFQGNAIDVTERKLATDAIRQTTMNYESFFNQIDDFLFVLDMQGNILHVNQTVTDRLGYSQEELQGQSILMVHPAERRIEAMDIVEKMLIGKALFCPVPIVTKSGMQIPVETRVTQGFWNGNPVIFGVTKDISQLRLSEEKFSKLFHINPSACGLSELENHRYLEVNGAFNTLFGYSNEEVLGKTAVELGIMSVEMVDTIMHTADASGRIFNADADLIAKNGDIKHVLLSAENIYVQDKKYRYTVVNDVTEIKNAENEIKYLSYHDQLTGLSNRRFYDEEIIRINSQSNYPITLVMTDMNNMKRVNDKYGHTTGDRSLIIFANVLQRNFRESDRIARIGGDEFVVILPKTDSAETAKIIERINVEISTIHIENLSLSAAFGWKTMTNNLTSFEALFKAAEDMMYSQKEKDHRQK